MLEGRDIQVRFGDVEVLAGVSLTVAPGEVVVIVGPNGAGKSTLLAALSGALMPDGGLASIDGLQVSGLTPRQLALRRAVLEQSPSRNVPFPVRDLISLAIDRAVSPDRTAAFVHRAVAAMGLCELAETGVDRLSGGESHRAHLARTLAQLWAAQELGVPGYLLIDEPTASLDLAHQQAVLRAARDAASSGAGVMIILHDLTVAAAVADRVVILNKGKIEADGHAHHILTPSVLESIYGVPIIVLDTGGQMIITPRMAKSSKVPKQEIEKCLSP